MTCIDDFLSIVVKYDLSRTVSEINGDTGKKHKTAYLISGVF